MDFNEKGFIKMVLVTGFFLKKKRRKVIIKVKCKFSYTLVLIIWVVFSWALHVF